MDQDRLNHTTRFQRAETEPAIGTVRMTIFDSASGPKEIDLSGFGKAVVTFGRGEGNDIILRSEYVSRQHGQFRHVGGQWVVEDLGSRNGLIFSGHSVRNRVLEDGDCIRIDDGVETTVGGLLMVFTRSENAAEWKTIDIPARAETLIGRDAACDIVLNHVSVSKRHAKIIMRGNQFFLTDNNSTNGLLVNGKKVENQCLLSEKDVILITNSKLIFGSGKVSYCCFNKGISVDALNITKKVDKNRKTICNNVSLSIKPCELVAIIGGSGAGKSTVMNCISGYSLPTEGSVSVNGTDLYDNFDALKNIIGYVPQQDIVFDNLTVTDMLGYAARLRLPRDLTDAEYDQTI